MTQEEIDKNLAEHRAAAERLSRETPLEVTLDVFRDLIAVCDGDPSAKGYQDFLRQGAASLERRIAARPASEPTPWAPTEEQLKELAALLFEGGNRPVDQREFLEVVRRVAQRAVEMAQAAPGPSKD